MNKLLFNDLQVDTHYWMHNISPLSEESIWRVVECVQDKQFNNKCLLTIGSVDRMFESFILDWHNVYFIKIDEPKGT